MKVKMIIKLLISILIFQSTLLGCKQQENKTNIDNIKLYQNKIEFPYTASEKREKVILDNMNKLKKGMNENQVIKLLSDPDEINLTYKSINSKSENNVIGYSLTYILRRNQASGSVNEKDEKLIKIHFDNSRKLTRTFSIDIEEFNTIENNIRRTE